MTIGGALSDLNNLFNADDIPFYYKPSIKAVMDTIALELNDCSVQDENEVSNVLDIIRAEIEEQKQERCFDDDDMFVYRTGLDDALYIVDKHRETQAESEDKA